ncbi:hypothetical protein [Phycicoccus sp. Root563]|uniref:hypothetical protein n=1 Tax=Phycicoccus sp. Root563 TaxID=1736562 RepID=UPI001F1A3C8D|nr:hypothetical protein [Phycicoccus sp. Root563]
MKLLRPGDDDEFDGPFEDALLEGLPDGLEPPPTSGLEDLEWQAEVDGCARLGIPRPGGPVRELAFERGVVGRFVAHMHDLDKWAARQRALLLAVRVDAAARCSHLEQEGRRLDVDVATTESDLEAQREQLADRADRFASGNGVVDKRLVMGIVCLAGVEVLVLTPLIGVLMGDNVVTASAFACLVVGVVGYGSWQLGCLLHRWLAYEGPPRLRRALGLTALALGVLAVTALAAVVLARLVGLGDLAKAEADAPVLSAQDTVVSALVFLAVQGLVQLISGIHGYRHGNPRLRELAGTQAYLSRVRTERDEVVEQLGEMQTWAETLDEFRVGEWLTRHRSAIAACYEARDHLFRSDLEKALVHAGQHASADMLLILPIPRFVPPVDHDDDDALGGWRNGFLLRL